MGESNLGPVMNLANSIVGVSILAMPYCFSQCGILLGILLLLLCTLFTGWTCKMLMRASIMTRSQSYENLALAVYGKVGKYTTGVSVIGLNLGTCIAFFVIIGDLAPPIIAQATSIDLSPWVLRAVVLILAALLIAFPLGLCRSVSSLSGISLCSLLFYAMFTVQLAFISYSRFSWKLWRTLSWWNSSGFFKCIPIFSLAFSCQTQLFVIYGGLKDASFRRISSIIDGATFSIATLYSLVACFGYFTYHTDGVKGDVLSNFDVNWTSQLFRLAFSLSVVVSFPLMIFPCRVSINSLFFSSKSLELHVQEPIPQKRFVAITAFIIGFTLTVAILIPKVETVLGLTGATTGSLIAFILPSVMFLKVAGSKADFSNKAKVCAGLGVCVMLLSTAIILQTEMDADRTITNPSLNGRRPHPRPPPINHPPEPHPPESRPSNHPVQPPSVLTPLPPGNRPPDDHPPIQDVDQPPDDRPPDQNVVDHPPDDRPPDQNVVDHPPDDRPPDQNVVDHPPDDRPPDQNVVDHPPDDRPPDQNVDQLPDDRPPDQNVVDHPPDDRPPDQNVDQLPDDRPPDQDVIRQAVGQPPDDHPPDVGQPPDNGGNMQGVANVEGVANVGGPEVKEDHQEIQDGLSQLQSRISHLEEENKDLKQRQELIENIQMDDMLHKPEVLQEVEVQAEDNIPGQAVQAVPDQVVPDQVVPDQVVPDQVVPDQVVPDQVVPDQVVPDQVVPDQVVPDQVVPDQVVPDQVVPDQVVPAVDDHRMGMEDEGIHKRNLEQGDQRGVEQGQGDRGGGVSEQEIQDVDKGLEGGVADMKGGGEEGGDRGGEEGGDRGGEEEENGGGKEGGRRGNRDLKAWP